MTASGTAKAVKPAGGTPSIPVITASGDAVRVARKATGTPTMPMIAASGTAKVRKSAAGTPSIPKITASGTAVSETLDPEAVWGRFADDIRRRRKAHKILKGKK